MKNLISISALLLLAVACGGGGTARQDPKTNPNAGSPQSDTRGGNGATTLSCNYSQENICQTVSVPSAGNAATLDYCQSPGSVVASCSLNSCIGTCTMSATRNGYTGKIVTYYYSALDAEGLDQACQMGNGVFSATCN